MGGRAQRLPPNALVARNALQMLTWRSFVVVVVVAVLCCCCCPWLLRARFELLLMLLLVVVVVVVLARAGACGGLPRNQKEAGGGLCIRCTVK